MPELTLESIKHLLDEKLKPIKTGMATLATSKDLAEQMEFLTKHAAHKDDVAALSEHLDKKFAEHKVATVTYTVGEGTGRLPHRCCI